VWSWTYLWAFWFLLVLFVIYYLRGPLKISENIGMGNGCTFLWQREQYLKVARELQINQRSEYYYARTDVREEQLFMLMLIV